MRIIVASQNPVKIASVREGFSAMFPNQEFVFSGVSAPSGVSEQPTSSDEALQGARNRAENAAKTTPNGDFFVGLEGGVEDRDGELHSFAWIAVRDKNGKIGRGKTGEFILPAKIRELILEGMELGDADNVVFGKSNSKQVNGAIGLLTHDAIDRTKLYTQAVAFALIPFLNPELY